MSGRSSKIDQEDHLIIEHYECCHKPLPEFSNIDTLSEVHHALGFLPEPSFKQVLLEEITPIEDDLVKSDSPKVERATEDKVVHCLKVINGELFLLCNIRTRQDFIKQNLSSFDEASCIEV